MWTSTPGSGRAASASRLVPISLLCALVLRHLRALQPLVGLGQAVVASASGWVVALRDNAVLTWQYCHKLVPSNRILLLPSCVCACRWLPVPSVPTLARSDGIHERHSSPLALQLSSRMGYIAASLAVCMLLAVALSGSDEGSGLAVKSARITAAKATILSEGRKEKIYARKEMMNQVINKGLAGLPVKDVAIAKGLIAKAGKLPTLAAMKTTKLQDADCANKDVYEMILGALPFVSARTTGGREMEALSGHTGIEL